MGRRGKRISRWEKNAAQTSHEFIRPARAGDYVQTNSLSNIVSNNQLPRGDFWLQGIVYSLALILSWGFRDLAAVSSSKPESNIWTILAASAGVLASSIAFRWLWIVNRTTRYTSATMLRLAVTLVELTNELCQRVHGLITGSSPLLPCRVPHYSHAQAKTDERQTPREKLPWVRSWL